MLFSFGSKATYSYLFRPPNKMGVAGAFFLPLLCRKNLSIGDAYLKSYSFVVQILRFISNKEFDLKKNILILS